MSSKSLIRLLCFLFPIVLCLAEQTLDKLDGYVLSKLRYELRLLPMPEQCARFWLELETELNGDNSKGKDRLDDRALVDQVDIGMLIRVRDFIKNKKSLHGNKSLGEYLDECIRSLTSRHKELDSQEQKEPPSPTASPIERPAIEGPDQSSKEAPMDLGQNEANEKKVSQIEASNSNNSELTRMRAENELLKIRVESLESSQTALKQYCSETELLRQRVDVLEVKEIALKKQAAENDSLRDKVKELESLLQAARNDLSTRMEELHSAKTISMANKSELENCRSDLQVARTAAAEFETEKEIWEDRVVESEIQTEEANKSLNECKKNLEKLETQMEGVAKELEEAQEAKRTYEGIARSYRVKLQSLLGGNSWGSTYVYQ